MRRGRPLAQSGSRVASRLVNGWTAVSARAVAGQALVDWEQKARDPVSRDNRDIGVTQIAHRLGISAPLYRYIPLRDRPTRGHLTMGALPHPKDQTLPGGFRPIDLRRVTPATPPCSANP